MQIEVNPLAVLALLYLVIVGVFFANYMYSRGWSYIYADDHRVKNAHRLYPKTIKDTGKCAGCEKRVLANGSYDYTGGIGACLCKNCGTYNASYSPGSRTHWK